MAISRARASVVWVGKHIHNSAAGDRSDTGSRAGELRHAIRFHDRLRHADMQLSKPNKSELLELSTCGNGKLIVAIRGRT